MSSFDAVDFILVKVLVFIILSPFTSAPWSSFIFTEVAFGVEITASNITSFFISYLYNKSKNLYVVNKRLNNLFAKNIF